MLLAVGYGAYMWGWWKAAAYVNASSAIAHSQADLFAARALRSRNYPEALKWLEIDLNSNEMTFVGLKNNVPREFAITFAKVASLIAQYKSEFHTTLKHDS